MVFDFELHKAHVCWVGELCDDAKSWEQSTGNKETITNGEKNQSLHEIAERVQAKPT